MTKYDVAVVGLGAAGSAALYQLSKSGANVIGIDRFAPPHSRGSSFGESRVTRQSIGEGSVYGPMLQRSNEIWHELETLSGRELFNHCGMLLTGYEDQIFFRDTVANAKSAGIEHQILDGQQVEHLFPAIKAAQSDHAYYYEPTSGFLRPEACIDVQLTIAKDNGVTILNDSKVISLEELADSVIVSFENGDSITAGKVIVAAGPWIKELLADELSSYLKTYLYSIYWYGIENEHLDELEPGKLPVMLNGVNKAPRTRAFSGFPAIAGPQGGIKFVLDDSDLEASIGEKDDRGLVQPGFEELTEYVQRYVRHVKPDVLRSHNCMYTATPDGDFIIDYAPGSKRIVVGSACSGHGFKHSAATGEALAQLALDNGTLLDIGKFSLQRF